MTKDILWAALVAALLNTTACYGHEHGDDHTHDEQTASAERDAPKTPPGPHGGVMHGAAPWQFEAVLSQGGLRVYAYDAKGKPVDMSQARGLAYVRVDGDSKRYRYDLSSEPARDKSAAPLVAAVDLSRIAGLQLDVEYHIAGLKTDQRQPIRFQTIASVAPTAQQRAAAAIAAQKICPVSKQPLGSMGAPIAVEVDGETIYVCCKGCVSAVEENPAKYLLGKRQLTVAPATEADAAAIARQEVCPVMDEPLGSMGMPIKVTGLERDVYLCCKGCLKFLEKEPEKYLAKMKPLPASAKPKLTKASKADAEFVAAQKTCPVMDEPLDAMGGPWKTVAAGRVVYLCCPGCAKKLAADPETYLAKLQSQGVTPPRAK